MITKIRLSLCCFAFFFILLKFPASIGFSEESSKQTIPSDKHFTNSLGMKLVRIEPGEFVMGTGDVPPKNRLVWQERDADEAPAHKVRISRPFFLGATEVTNAQFEQFDPDHKKYRGKEGVSRADDEPVTFVTWQQAADFCAWLAKKEKQPYRLPTEAEWEYACRAGTTTVFSTGGTLTPAQANFGISREGKATGTLPVGSYPANPWGLFDMHGNVAEWCLDWYGPYEASAQTDPVGRADGYARLTRGWSFLRTSSLNPTRYCRSANRSGHLPEDANFCTGFRVVLGELPATRPLPVVPSAYQQNVRQKQGADAPRSPKPFFLNFTKEGKNPVIPRDTWGPIFSQHNHYSAVCVCPNGDVLACWYSTVSEEGRELVQAGSRLRAGSDQWDPASLFFDVPDVNDHAPVLFCDGRRIYHFCTQSLKGWDHASNIMRISEDNGVTWSRPQIILPRDGPQPLSQPCTAFLDKNGILVLACDGDRHKDERVMISRDAGRTWKVGQGDMRQAMGGKYVIHPAVVDIGKGSILVFLRGQHPMPALVSDDLGDSWQPRPTPFPGISSGQKAVALRLNSGALLFCSIDSKKELVGGTFACLSFDDGKTWPHVRKVEGVGGYMSVAQASTGTIYLFGSRMGCVAFNEAWLKEGRPIR